MNDHIKVARDLLHDLEGLVAVLDSTIEESEELVGLRDDVRTLKHERDMIKRELASARETLGKLVAENVELKKIVERTFDKVGCPRCGDAMGSLGDNKYRCDPCEKTVTRLPSDMSDEGIEPWKGEFDGRMPIS